MLPLALSNYLYGLTSVDLGSYVLGSWAGMLPGTIAYVAAGACLAFGASRSVDTLIWRKLRVCRPPTEWRLDISISFASGRNRVEFDRHSEKGKSLRLGRLRAGSYGRELLDGTGEALKLQPWQIALGLAFTVAALSYISRIAKDVRLLQGLSFTSATWLVHLTMQSF